MQKEEKAIKVLIVEDEVIIARDLEGFLINQGYISLGIASTGQQALDIHAESEADLVLMDIILDETMNGIEAANRLQLSKVTPVIFLTALQKSVIDDEFKLPYPFTHLMKPYKDSELINAIEYLHKKNLEDKTEKDCKARFRQLSDFFQEGILVLDDQGKIACLNKKIEQMFNKEAQDLIGKDFSYPANPGEEKEITLEFLEIQIPVLIRTSEINWDNEFKYLLILKNLSREKEDKERNRILQLQLQLLMKRSVIGYFKIRNSNQGKLIEVNSAFIKKLGYKQYSALINKNFKDLMDDERIFINFINQTNKQGNLEGVPVIFLTNNGEKLKADLYSFLLENGEVLEGFAFYK